MKKVYLLCIILIPGMINKPMFAANNEVFTYKENKQIIPKPLNMIMEEGVHRLNAGTTIYFSSEVKRVAEIFNQIIASSTGYNLKMKPLSGTPSTGIVFNLDKTKDTLGDEGYTLTVTPKKTTITGSTYGGIFNGMQTLRQLLPPEVESDLTLKNIEWTVPCLSITDKPAYEWRGYMKDVSRTFYSVDVIKKYIDVMSLYKMNKLHLHLADDQGWRIEIKKYPQLTSEKTTRFPETLGQPEERSGYYTQEDIRELVLYATERNITLIPEIDIPGHCWPIIVAYPEFGVNQMKYPEFVFPFQASWKFWPNQFTPNTIDPTKEETYKFLSDVFDEIISLFPSEYIHIGGDEVMLEIWDKEPHVVNFMKEKSLKNSAELQHYFITRVCKMIVDKKRIPMGWNDIVRNTEGLPKETAIMSWVGRNSVKNAVSKEFKTVASPYEYLYLDVCQANRNDGTMAELAYSHFNSLERAYGYNPTENLTNEERRYLLGVQGNFWSHIAQDVKDMNVQVFPRLLVVSEIAWTDGSEKNFEEFNQRLNANLPRLDLLHIDYYRPGGYIRGVWTPDNIAETFSTVEWDVTDKVYDNGRIMAGFFQTKGEDVLSIKKVELIEDGKIIASDNKEGLAYKQFSRTPSKYLYNLTVDNYNPHATYILRVELRGYGGTSSYGNVTFNLNPYIPFRNTEPYKKE